MMFQEKNLFDRELVDKRPRQTARVLMLLTCSGPPEMPNG
jgi:hypothetical protein